MDLKYKILLLILGPAVIILLGPEVFVAAEIAKADKKKERKSEALVTNTVAN